MSSRRISTGYAVCLAIVLIFGNPVFSSIQARQVCRSDSLWHCNRLIRRGLFLTAEW